jgi:hypothetical protein
VDFYTTSWFPRIIWLQYLLSFIVAANFLYQFPSTNGTNDLISNISYLLKQYSVLFAINFGIIWLCTALWADIDLQRLLASSAVGKVLSKEPFYSVAWIIVLLALASFSVAYDLYAILIAISI